jgi:hypothetical protein
VILIINKNIEEKMKPGKENSELSRRDFIKKTAAGALGASFLGNIPSFVKGAVFNNSSSSKSKVVLVQNSDVINASGEVDLSILKEMLEKAITNFSGKKNALDFWKKNFTRQDIIGLKVNTLGLSNVAGSPAVNHFTAVTSSIINSFVSADFKEENFIIWDRSEDELISAGYTIQKEKNKARVLGNISFKNSEAGEGHSEEELKVGEKTTRLSKILTGMTTSMINIPQMKNHGTAGVTGALKNHYGTINNARDFHSNNATGPGIPEINLLDGIKNKQKLIIMDALMSVYNGGPRWDRSFMWPFAGILIATDPVAIDTIMFSIINEKRKSEGLPEISASNARHIKIAGEMGLGKYNLDEIDFVKINLG